MGNIRQLIVPVACNGLWLHLKVDFVVFRAAVACWLIAKITILWTRARLR